MKLKMLIISLKNSINFFVLKNLKKNELFFIFFGNFLPKIYSQYTLKILGYNNKINKQFVAFINKDMIKLCFQGFYYNVTLK
jgi:hypothetical protein